MWIDKVKKAMNQKRSFQNMLAFKPILMNSLTTQYKKLDGNSDSESEDWERVPVNSEAKDAKKSTKPKEELRAEKAKEKEEEKKKVEEPHVINEEQISSSDSSSFEDGNYRGIDKTEASDIIFAQYEEVHRAKKKFKCKFLNVMMKLSIGDYVAPKASAEIDY